MATWAVSGVEITQWDNTTQPLSGFPWKWNIIAIIPNLNEVINVTTKISKKQIGGKSEVFLE